jgi:hypothetical protein
LDGAHDSCGACSDSAMVDSPEVIFSVLLVTASSERGTAEGDGLMSIASSEELVEGPSDVVMVLLWVDNSFERERVIMVDRRAGFLTIPF